MTFYSFLASQRDSENVTDAMFVYVIAGQMTIETHKTICMNISVFGTVRPFRKYMGYEEM